MEHNSSLVNLSIPENVTKPIVAAKIQEAVMAALGGQEKIVASVIKQICETKVDSSGKVSSYSNSTDLSWIDYHVTKVIQEAVKGELINQMQLGAAEIKAELVRQLTTKKGATKVAEALLSSLDGTFKNSWTSQISVNFLSK